MRISACQTQEILGDVDAAVTVIQDFADRADAAGVELLLFPECFLQGYLVTGQHVHRHAFDVRSTEFAVVLARLAGIRQMLVLGMIERWRGRYYNTALVVTGGRVVGEYRKTFPTGGESVFTAGDTYPVFTYDGVRFGINICYDTQFPQAAAAVAAGGAQVLLVPAQNMMRREKAFWWQARHNEIRARRVQETGMWLISADVTGERDESRIGLGPTCVIDPVGQVVTQSPHGDDRNGHRGDRPAVSRPPPTSILSDRGRCGSSAPGAVDVPESTIPGRCARPHSGLKVPRLPRSTGRQL